MGTMTKFGGAEIWDEPVVCSQGGFPINGSHINHWKKRATEAAAEIARLLAALAAAEAKGFAAGVAERDALREALYECSNLARGWTEEKEAPEYLETIYSVACKATGEPIRALRPPAA